jgi:cytidine deaminase
MNDMTPDFTQIPHQLPDTLAAKLQGIITEQGFSANLNAEQVSRLTQDGEIDPQQLPLLLLPFAATYSYAPISAFHVGAIVRGASGTLYFGANMEFCGIQMGQTVHAEQAAIAHAWMSGEEKLTDIFIDTPPCGHCRQFMNELSGAENLMISLPNRMAKPLHHYLPEHFGPLDLGIRSCLMSPQSHQKCLSNTDPLVQSAITALNQSYAPYSQNFSGVAIEMNNAQRYQGAYAENAAFNPSLPPLQVALIQLRMGGGAWQDIKRVVLAEMASGKISHRIDTQATLQQLSPNIQFESIQVV